MEYLYRNKQQSHNRNAEFLDSNSIREIPQVPPVPLPILAAPEEVQVGPSETVFHPERGAILEQVSRELGDLGGFQDPAIQSHGCSYLLSAKVPLQGESWAGHHQRFSLPVSMIL